jgi:hypothetical protein
LDRSGLPGKTPPPNLDLFALPERGRTWVATWA